MKAYYDMLRDILESGEDRGDRTGVGTRSIFGYQARYRNIGENFPLDTTREINFRQIVGELLWFLKGDTNIRELAKQGFYLWHDWPLKNYTKNNPTEPLTRTQFNQRIVQDDVFAAMWGDCGPVYGKQWRAWKSDLEGRYDFSDDPWQTANLDNAGFIHSQGEYLYRYKTIDQITNLVEDLKKNPLSRRHIVSAWNVADIPAMIPSGLPPCHVLFQFYCSQLHLSHRVAYMHYHNEAFELESLVPDLLNMSKIQGEKAVSEAFDKENVPKYRLHCQMYQRSLDSVLGGPYNIAEYSLLTMMLAQQCNMVPGDFIHSIGDAHIYNDHKEKLQHQLARRPFEAPTVKIKKAKDIFSYTIDDFELIGYENHPAIRYPIAV